METKANVRGGSIKWLLVILFAVVVTQGCASFMTRPSVSQVVKMSQEGVPSEQIIAEMRKNDTVYYMSDEEMENLQKQGVSYSVTRYMREKRDQAMALETRRQSYYDTWIRDPVSGVF